MICTHLPNEWIFMICFENYLFTLFAFNSHPRKSFLEWIIGTQEVKLSRERPLESINQIHLQMYPIVDEWTYCKAKFWPPRSPDFAHLDTELEWAEYGEKLSHGQHFESMKLEVTIVQIVSVLTLSQKKSVVFCFT